MRRALLDVADTIECNNAPALALDQQRAKTDENDESLYMCNVDIDSIAQLALGLAFFSLIPRFVILLQREQKT